MTKPGAHRIKVDAWSCLCARCGHAWRTLEDPPARCASCKATNWQRPALYVRGEGTSRESIRRRALEAAAKKRRRIAR